MKTNENPSISAPAEKNAIPKNKVHFISSIRTKVILLVLLAMVIICVLNLIIMVPSVRSNMSNLSRNYIFDLAVAYGSDLEQDIEGLGFDAVMEKESLEKTLTNANLEGIESSYAYVVSSDGTMLYHPTADKIGKPVENAVVTGLVEQLQGGTVPEASVVSYDFNGVIKYASYYIDDAGSFILVITADEDEIMAPIQAVVGRSLTGSAVALLFCAILGFIVAGFIVKPILRITKIINKLSDLDFTESKYQKHLNARRDETGSMSRAISYMREQLTNTIAEIKNQSTALYSASDSLNGNSQETATTIHQVEQAVHDIAMNATSQANETQKATDNIVTIGNMVEQTMEETKTLHSTASKMQVSGNEAFETLRDLDTINRKAKEAIDIIYSQTHTTNESAVKIQEATSLITSIAEETNLLSLNASIEAARAGEQGRGFAVVANQISKLADQSNDSAKRIEQIISSLISDSAKAVETMDRVKEIMEEQNKDVTKTEENFVQVKDGIDQALSGVAAITQSAEEMDLARTTVIDVVQNLTSIAEANAAGSEETSASASEVSNIISDISDNAKELHKIAKHLEHSMSIFKL